MPITRRGFLGTALATLATPGFRALPARASALRATTLADAELPGTVSSAAAQWRSLALGLTQQIDREFLLTDTNVYALSAQASGPGGKADDFSSNTQQRVLNSAAAQLGASYRSKLEAFSTAFDDWYLRFGSVSNELGSTAAGSRSLGTYTPLVAYNASALDSAGFSRFYDDNGGNLIAHLESYELDTSNPIHLRRAKEIFDFMLTGEDSSGGGGLYQHEADFDSSYPGHRPAKIATATVEAIMGGLKVHQLTGSPPARFYLQPCQRWYTWLNATLQDTDGLYFQNIQTGPGTYTNAAGQVVDVQAGDVVPIKLTHNAGYPLIANLLFASIESDNSYLTEAERIAQAAISYWVDSTTGGLTGHWASDVDVWGRYAYKLVDGWMDLYAVTGDTTWYDVSARLATWVYNNVRDPNGHYATNWGAKQSGVLSEWQLIDQASVARTFWRLASASTTPVDG